MIRLARIGVSVSHNDENSDTTLDTNEDDVVSITDVPFRTFIPLSDTDPTIQVHQAAQNPTCAGIRKCPSVSFGILFVGKVLMTLDAHNIS